MTLMQTAILSAMTLSPSSSRCSTPQFLVTLLEGLPPQISDTKVTVPFGVTPMRNLNVLWCL